jgi:type II secretory pathway pseudopilin PulG
MDNENGGTQVVIKLDQRVFYGLVAIIGVLGVFVVGVFLGRMLSGSSQQTAQLDRSAILQQMQQQAQPGQAQPFQAQPDQANPFQQQAVPVAKPPAGEDVPIGDNPRLAIPELADKNYTYDFGDIGPQQKVEKTFSIKNIGTKDLIIEDVSSSCGCTAALISENIIPPGGEAELLVTYDPRVNKDQGRFVTRKVRIRSNDPAAPLAEFTITANVGQ